MFDVCLFMTSVRAVVVVIMEFVRTFCNIRNRSMSIRMSSCGGGGGGGAYVGGCCTFP